MKTLHHLLEAVDTFSVLSEHRIIEPAQDGALFHQAVRYLSSAEVHLRPNKTRSQRVVM